VAAVIVEGLWAGLSWAPKQKLLGTPSLGLLSLRNREGRSIQTRILQWLKTVLRGLRRRAVLVSPYFSVIMSAQVSHPLLSMDHQSTLHTVHCC
jgi:hypothetical protein